jgi:hypothetical protein
MDFSKITDSLIQIGLFGIGFITLYFMIKKDNRNALKEHTTEQLNEQKQYLCIREEVNIVTIKFNNLEKEFNDFKQNNSNQINELKTDISKNFSDLRIDLKDIYNKINTISTEMYKK